MDALCWDSNNDTPSKITEAAPARNKTEISAIPMSVGYGPYNGREVMTELVYIVNDFQ